MRNVSGKFVEKIETYVSCSKNVFRNPAVYEIMRKDIVEPDRPQMTIEYGAEKKQFSCRLTKPRIEMQTRSI
jgi:hypothetical protein